MGGHGILAYTLHYLALLVYTFCAVCWCGVILNLNLNLRFDLKPLSRNAVRCDVMWRRFMSTTDSYD